MDWLNYLIDAGWDDIQMRGLGGSWELVDVEGDVTGGGMRSWPSTGADNGHGTLELVYQFQFDRGEYEDARSLAGELEDDLERLKLGMPYIVERLEVTDANNSTSGNGSEWAYAVIEVKITAYYN